MIRLFLSNQENILIRLFLVVFKFLVIYLDYLKNIKNIPRNFNYFINLFKNDNFLVVQG